MGSLAHYDEVCKHMPKPFDADQANDVAMTIRVNAEEKRQWDLAAREAGISTARWIRESLNCVIKP